MRHGWLIASAALSIAVSVLVWATLHRSQESTLHEVARAEATTSARAVERDLALRLTQLSSIGRSAIVGGVFNKEVFEDQAAEFQALYGGVEALVFLDVAGQVQSGFPDEAAKIFGSTGTTASTDVLPMLQFVMQHDQPAISHPAPLLPKDALAITLLTPIVMRGQLQGYLGALLCTTDWIENLLFGVTSPTASRDFAKTVFLDGQPAFVNDDFGTLRSPVVTTEEVAVFNTSVKISLQARPRQVMGAAWFLPEALGLTVVVLGFMAVFAIAQQARARRAETAARQAQKATADFLATMSHEVRTPLNAIMGMFELIERAETSERTRRQAQAGRSAALRLFSELSSVLDASRLDAGAVTVSKSVVPLPELVIDWSDTLVALTERAGGQVSAVLDIQNDLPAEVFLDAERVAKILNNLFDNAVKFTTDGRITFSVRTVGDALELTLADTGIGIPAHRVPNIFKRFYQVEDSRTRGQNGAGLGLAICAELAALMGARLELKKTVADVAGTTEPSGSTFCLTLTGALVLQDPKDSQGSVVG